MGDTWIFITGATSGIGRACAEHLARRGYSVIATGRNEAALRELDELARSEGLRLETLPLDITSDDAVRAAAGRAFELTEGKGIDILVNNAGTGQAGYLTDLSPNELRAQYDVSLFGLHAVTQALLPQLRARRGTIINMGSIMGRMTAPWMGAYGSVKAAVRSLTETLRVELGALGVRVVLIEPGAIESSFHERAIEGSMRAAAASSPFAGSYAWLEQSHYRPFYLMPPAPVRSLARLVERIASTPRPKARYLFPFGARLLLLFMAVVPRRIMDRLKRRVFHLQG